MNMPIIRIEIESMRHTLHTMLSEHAALLDEQMKLALDEALKPENVRHFLNTRVTEVMREAISQEVKELFGCSSAGRAAIREAVHKFANEHYGVSK